MKSAEIIAAVNDCSHRLVFHRSSEVWSVEQHFVDVDKEQSGWLPGLVVREFEGMAAMKDGVLTAVDGHNHVFFYPSIQATLDAIAKWTHGGMLPTPMAYVAQRAIDLGLLHRDRVTDKLTVVEEATC